MSGYKLADGSLSTQYQVGDSFVVTTDVDSMFPIETEITLIKDDGTASPRFASTCDDHHEDWDLLVPTEATKKKYSKSFTNGDFQDGMRVTLRDGSVCSILGDNLLHFNPHGFYGNGSWEQATYLSNFKDDLSHNSIKRLDIMYVVDRDGTVLFERKEEPVKKTMKLELTQEQIDSLKEQGII